MIETLALITLGIIIGFAAAVHVFLRWPPRRRPLDPLPPWPPPLDTHIRSAIRDRYRREE